MILANRIRALPNFCFQFNFFIFEIEFGAEMGAEFGAEIEAEFGAEFEAEIDENLLNLKLKTSRIFLF